jgi:hypothetical protein
MAEFARRRRAAPLAPRLRWSETTMKKSRIVLRRTAVRMLTADALEGVAGASLGLTCRPCCQIVGCNQTAPINCTTNTLPHQSAHLC